MPQPSGPAAPQKGPQSSHEQVRHRWPLLPVPRRRYACRVLAEPPHRGGQPQGRRRGDLRRRASTPGTPTPSTASTARRGGFITDFDFDPSGYLLDPGHLARLDRIFHWSLHVAREALRDSGNADRPEILARTGLILGQLLLPHAHVSPRSACRCPGGGAGGPARGRTPALGALAGPRRRSTATLSPENLRVSGSPAGVAAAALGLGGPRYALDAACSSALYALKLACDHLAAGRPTWCWPAVSARPTRRCIHLSFSDLHAYPPRRLQPALRRPLRRHPHRPGRAACSPSSGWPTRCATATGSTPSSTASALPTTAADAICWSRRAPARPQSYELAYAAGGHRPDHHRLPGVPRHRHPHRRRDRGRVGGRVLRRRGQGPADRLGQGQHRPPAHRGRPQQHAQGHPGHGHGHIPPTTGVDRPSRSKDGRVGDDALVRTGREWPARRGTAPGERSPRSASAAPTRTSVLSEPVAETVTEAPRPPCPRSMWSAWARTSARFDSLDAFERAVHDGSDALPAARAPLARPRPDPRRPLEHGTGVSPDALPHGAFVDGLGIDPRRPQASRRGPARRTTSTRSLSKVADEALHDAGFSRAGLRARPLPHRAGSRSWRPWRSSP